MASGKRWRYSDHSEFEQRIHKAELRAKRKIRRLQKVKGIHTGAIDPTRRDISHMSTADKRKYEKQLESFISRQNRYEAGAEGTPIQWSTVKQIRSAERALNAKRAKMWGKVANKPIIPGSPMTVADARNVQRIVGPSGNLIPNPKSHFYGSESKHADISKLKGERGAREYLDKIRFAATAEYDEKKNQQLRENMHRALRNLNVPELNKRIDALSDEQLHELSLGTTFLESIFMNSGNDDILQVQGTVAHLNSILDEIV